MTSPSAPMSVKHSGDGSYRVVVTGRSTDDPDFPENVNYDVETILSDRPISVAGMMPTGQRPAADGECRILPAKIGQMGWLTVWGDKIELELAEGLHVEEEDCEEPA